MKHIVIIGNGISGITTARYIRKNNPDIQISVIGNETDYFYARTALMYVYMGHLRFEDTKPYEDQFWKKNRINCIRGEVVRLITEKQKLYLSDGQEISYHQLVLATGSKPLMAGWAGEHLNGIQGLYGMTDLALLEENTQHIRRAVVVGGGLIGVELAEMLHARGIHVTFLVRESRYMERTLPPEESELVHQEIRRNGIDLLFETEVKAFLPDEEGRVAALETTSGLKIPTAFVGITIGVTPNIAWLADNGIETKKGVLVDWEFKTNVPDVFAVGDCAEFRKPLGGQRPIEQFWYTGKMHGEVLGTILGGGKASYQKGVFFNSAKFFDLEYQVYGEVAPILTENTKQVFWRHPVLHKSIRIRYNKSTGAVVGFCTMGTRFRQEVCRQWIQKNTPIEKVLENLQDAFFDPEFFDTFGDEVRAEYASETGQSHMTVRKKNFWTFFKP